MRVCIALLVFFCALVGQAWAFSGASECKVYWSAYSLGEGEGLAASPPLPALPLPGQTAASSSPGGRDGRLLLALTLELPSGRYVYGPDSAEGLPTRVDVDFALLDAFPMAKMSSRQIDELLEKNGAAASVRAPAARPKNATVFSSVSLPGGGDGNPDIYPGPLTFWAEVPVSPPGLGGLAIRVRMSGLLCSASSCEPLSGELDLSFAAAAITAMPPASGQAWWAALQRGEDVLLPPAEAALAGDFFPRGGEALYAPAPNTPQSGERNEAHAALFESLEPVFFNPALEVGFFGEALFFGLVAGLLLNLMPCVLPVVSLKFSALMAVSSMTDKQKQARAFKVHCLIFAAGIMVWFLVLAFLLGGAGWAWGEMFQKPLVIVLLGAVLFILGLSLFGVFPLPIFDFKVTSGSHPRWQAFASGLLATLLATPCSGPLLGGVLAWAIRQPLPVLGLCVISVGLGMSLPYCVLAFCPGLVHLLPRPGAWTLRLEQLLGFFLMGSVAYLATLLPEKWLPAFLFNLFTVAFACWLWGQIGHLGAGRPRRVLARSMAVAVVLLSIWWGASSIKPDHSWEAFDPQTFTELLGKQPLLLEFTADWCPSCKALEYTTLNKSRMEDLRRRYNVRTIRVDLTRNEGVGREGKELLKALDSTSIPVLALFSTGEKARRPVVLRDLATPTQLEEAAAAAFEGTDGFLRATKGKSLCLLPEAMQGVPFLYRPKVDI